MGGPIAHVVLVGLMGSGKSTVGRALAARLGWPFVDNDDQLREMEGRTASRIETEDGARALDRAEVRALLRALGAPGPTVVAAAAAVIEDPRARESLEHPSVVVVWLDADPAVLAARAASGEHRPWSTDGPAATLRRQYGRRAAAYAALAALVVDVGTLDPDAAADRIEGHLRGLGDPLPASDGDSSP